MFAGRSRHVCRPIASETVTENHMFADLSPHFIEAVTTKGGEAAPASVSHPSVHCIRLRWSPRRRLRTVHR